jgi:hypothetical protein
MCTYGRVYTYMHVCMYVYVSQYVHLSINRHMHLHMHIYIYIYTELCVYTHRGMQEHTQTYIHIFMYIYEERERERDINNKKRPGTAAGRKNADQTYVCWTGSLGKYIQNLQVVWGHAPHPDVRQRVFHTPSNIAGCMPAASNDLHIHQRQHAQAACIGAVA